MNIIGVIPARYASTRFPGKPLALINGKPLIQHVVERCQKAAALREIIVATDDTRIWEAVQDFCRVEMTSPDHPSGTDRLAEVVGRSACDAASSSNSGSSVPARGRGRRGDGAWRSRASQVPSRLSPTWSR